jgi:hypothetical protein
MKTKLTLFVFTLCIGYYLHLIGGAPKEGEDPNWSYFKSLTIPIKSNNGKLVYIHVHHWIYLTFIVVLSIYYQLFAGIWAPILHGACAGGVIHGIGY